MTVHFGLKPLALALAAVAAPALAQTAVEQ